jgi:hypothetical protein
MTYQTSLPPETLDEAVKAISPAIAEAALRRYIPLMPSDAEQVAMLVVAALTEASFFAIINRAPDAIPTIHHIVADKLKSFAITRLTIALARTHL